MTGTNFLWAFKLNLFRVSHYSRLLTIKSTTNSADSHSKAGKGVYLASGQIDTTITRPFLFEKSFLVLLKE